MNLDAPFTVTVSVNKTGSGNVARVMKHGITASCTSSADAAMDAAVLKLMKRNWPDQALKVEHEVVSDTVSNATYIVTLSPVPASAFSALK